MTSRPFLLWLILALTSLLAPATHAQDQKLIGTIRDFECGDNCYLTIVDTDSAEQVGLCIASECEDWLADAAMPETYIGKRVEVTTGLAPQIDGSANVMGEMMAFTQIDFLD